MHLFIKRGLTALAATLAVAAGLAAPSTAAPSNATAVAAELAAPPVPALTGSPVKGGIDAPKGFPGKKATQGSGSARLTTCSNYEYAAGVQTFTGGANVAGFVANAMVTKPFLNTSTACHSLVELAAQSGSTYGDIVEVGATVDPGVNSGCTPNPACLSEPFLFVYHWKNGATTCYNGCGWVDNPSNPINAGAPLSAVASAAFPANVKKFGLYHDTSVACGASAGGWWAAYDNVYLGCFPDSEWASPAPTFPAATRIQAFWEVSSVGTVDCSDEGQLGRQGSAAVLPLDATDPAYIGSITLTNPSPAATANVIPFVSPASGTGNSVQGFASGGFTRTITGGGTGTNSSGGLPGNATSC
jgi:hypothetical protein